MNQHDSYMTRPGGLIECVCGWTVTNRSHRLAVKVWRKHARKEQRR